MRMLSADLLLITEEHFIYKTFRFSSFPFRIELLEMLEQTVDNTLCSSRKCFFLGYIKNLPMLFFYPCKNGKAVPLRHHNNTLICLLVR